MFFLFLIRFGFDMSSSKSNLSRLRVSITTCSIDCRYANGCLLSVCLFLFSYLCAFGSHKCYTERMKCRRNAVIYAFLSFNSAHIFEPHQENHSKINFHILLCAVMMGVFLMFLLFFFFSRVAFIKFKIIFDLLPRSIAFLFGVFFCFYVCFIWCVWVILSIDHGARTLYDRNFLCFYNSFWFRHSVGSVELRRDSFLFVCSMMCARPMIFIKLGSHCLSFN